LRYHPQCVFDLVTPMGLETQSASRVEAVSSASSSNALSLFLRRKSYLPSARTI
ncbi:hypothetical protein VCHENC02_2087B, partial [Vibrio harveyi]